jgi:hypothetical protein
VEERDGAIRATIPSRTVAISARRIPLTTSTSGWLSGRMLSPSTVSVSACCRLGPAADRSALAASSVWSRPSWLERKCVSGMTYSKSRWLGGWLTLMCVATLTLAAGCGSSDGLSPSAETPSSPVPTSGDPVSGEPADPASLPTDSLPSLPSDSTGTVAASTLTAGTQPGIAFGSYGMEPADLNTVHTGTLRGGGVTEDNVLSLLSAIRAKGGRLVLKMCMGEDKYVKNPDGTFSLTKWKALVDRFRKVNLGPYISDGTLVGHFLIDEPQRPAKWGGKIISQATVEAMAAYSKQFWPTLNTLVRVAPSWLASAPITYRALDAGWLQYAADKGDPARLVSSEATLARNKGLGLVIGLNILDGGNGSSGVPGWRRGKYAMSAAEIKNYGTALLANTYGCGFFNWTYQYFGPTYYARADIKSAFTDISNKARAHARTSCSQ